MNVAITIKKHLYYTTPTPLTPPKAHAEYSFACDDCFREKKLARILHPCCLSDTSYLIDPNASIQRSKSETISPPSSCDKPEYGCHGISFVFNRSPPPIHPISEHIGRNDPGTAALGPVRIWPIPTYGSLSRLMRAQGNVPHS